MLKALELVGFKSFADKTRFDFHPGITCVVGPNGSGKSNVVDAIKWVLGEQSVKSLRGKEMADVIFNGSGSRPPLNTAETTLTFDNSKRLLALDTSEVHITRRVYRSGEGEYLINRQPCRLRDIRELFSGTGVATEAYSVIEQGKVDVMLQSSPKERRMIFEEAAGISRFKAKKIESQRRLERVEQNLLRLSDIVNEVEGRLRSVRAQAGKARRYKEHVDRLQELRTQVGLADWRSLSEKLAGIEEEIQKLADDRDAANAKAELVEAQALALETTLANTTETLREREARAADIRQRIATCDATIGHERARLRDLDDEIGRHRSQLAAMSVRAGDLRQQLYDTFTALQGAEEQHHQTSQRAETDEAQLSKLIAEFDTLRAEGEQRREALFDAMRTATAESNEAAALESQIETARAAQARGEQRLADLDAMRQALEKDLTELWQSRDEQAARVAAQQQELAEAQERLIDLRRQQTSKTTELNQLRQRQTGATERCSVLEELESRFEGLSAGVKDVLLAAREAGEGPFRHIHGLVADLFRASVEIAPLIDVALGERAQRLVVGPHAELLSFLEQQTYRLKGRVSFIRLDLPPDPASAKLVDLEGQPGIVGRADRFVETTPELEPLAKRLLGQTWIVEKLTQARALAEGPGRGLNFVTLAGETISTDGTIAVGPRQSNAGLISRRSELRALKQMVAELDKSVAAASSAMLQIEQQITDQNERIEKLTDEHRRAADALAEKRSHSSAVEARLADLDEQHAVLAIESSAAAKQAEDSARTLAQVGVRRDEVEAKLAELEAALAEVSDRMATVAKQRQQCERGATAAQIELAKSEERLRNLQVRQQQFERDQQERERSIAEAQSHLAQSQQRRAVAEMAILVAESEAAELYLRKEQMAAETIEFVQLCDRQRQERTTLASEAQKIRTSARKLEERLHARDLAAGEVRHERSTLADRLREDYGIELAELEHTPTAEEQHEREAVDQEIAELRRKINNIGNVNLEALEELEGLETRFAALSEQFQDLSKAKAQLEQIIIKINVDSRKLFTATLEAVRINFQSLFRKLFGGGQGDIILEEGVDILESGIEIVARPPGKEPRNISLLSGGEKTLTCVALLLSIFQYRPSPFCVLDEVDAALDEANIGRFITVLQEFMAWTQFIIISHSKKTMTCAGTLYGVTMQESGISKRVAVRFEDVSEDGHIRPNGDTPPDDSDDVESDETQAA